MCKRYWISPRPLILSILIGSSRVRLPVTLEGVVQTKAFVLGRSSGAGGWECMREITRCVCTLVTTIKSLMYAGEYCHTQAAVLQQAMTHWFCCIAWCCLLHYTCCRTCNTVKEDWARRLAAYSLGEGGCLTWTDVLRTLDFIMAPKIS